MTTRSAPLAPSSAKDTIVAFFNAPQLKGSVQLLNIQKPSFQLLMVDAAGVASMREIRFDQIKMLGILRKPGAPEPIRPPAARIVTIRFMDGHMIRGVSEPYAKSSSVGMFILPLRPETLERVFIPLSAIREVLAVDKLGDPADEPSIMAPLPTEQPSSKRLSSPQLEPLGEVLAPPASSPAVSSTPQGASLRAPAAPKKLGEILLEQRFVDQSQIDEALGFQETQRRKRFGEILVEMGFATHKMIAVALAMQWRVPFLDLATHAADPRLVAHVPAWFARRWRVMPVSESRGVLTVAVTDPIEHEGVVELRKTTGLKVVMVLATPQDITRALNAYYPKHR